MTTKPFDSTVFLDSVNIDVFDEIRMFIYDNWAVGGVKPLIDLIENHKRVDLQFGGGKDAVLIYGLPAYTLPFGLGYGYERTFQSVSIDIRTAQNKERLMVLKNEVIRLMHLFRKKGGINKHDLVVYEKSTPLSNKTIKLWREIVEVSVRDYAKTIVV